MASCLMGWARSRAVVAVAPGMDVAAVGGTLVAKLEELSNVEVSDGAVEYVGFE